MPDILRRALSACALAALVAGGGTLLWRQHHTAVGVLAEVASAEHLLSFADPNAITSLALCNLEGDHFDMARDPQALRSWRLVSHRAILAEASAVEAMLRASLDLRAQRRVVPNQQDGNGRVDLNMFGLDPPRATLSLTGTIQPGGSPRTETLMVGKKNNFDGSLYVMRAGDRTVSMVPAAFTYQVDRDLYKLRDKRAAAFATDAVQSVTQAPTTFGPGYQLVREGDTYRLLKPFAAAADRAAVDGLLTSLATLRGRRVVAEVAREAHLAVFGLQKPRFDVAISLQGGQSLRLLFGEIQVRGETHAFVRQDDPEAPVWELDSDWPMQALRQQAEALRDMRVLMVDAAQVHRVALHRGDARLTLVRADVPGAAGPQWQISGAKAVAVHASAVAALLKRLVNLKALHIASEAVTPEDLRRSHLHRPTFEVEVFDAGDHLLASLLLGEEADDGIWATTDHKRRLDIIDRSDRDVIAAPFSAYTEADASSPRSP